MRAIGWTGVLVGLLIGAAGCGAPGSSLPDMDEESGSSPDGLSGEVSSGDQLRATGNVNLRSGPSTAHSILTVVQNGDVATALDSAPDGGFYRIDYHGTAGWSSGKYLERVGEPEDADSFAGGQLWEMHATTLPMEVSVFVPAAAADADAVDVLLYMHGHNVCSPVASDPPRSFVTGAPFELAQAVADSGKPVVLVVPFLDWEHLAAKGLAFSGKKHRLGLPENLDGVVAQAMGEVTARLGAAPDLSRLILAGHSRAYDVLNPLAARWSEDAMSSGALGSLAAVWAFDTSYACSPISDWKSWMNDKPGLEVDLFYKKGTGTAACGAQFASLASSFPSRMHVSTVSESHCDVPAKRLGGLLEAL
jgi:uncharacterized protein YraI